MSSIYLVQTINLFTCYGLIRIKWITQESNCVGKSVSFFLRIFDHTQENQRKTYI